MSEKEFLSFFSLKQFLLRLFCQTYMYYIRISPDIRIGTCMCASSPYGSRAGDKLPSKKFVVLSDGC